MQNDAPEFAFHSVMIAHAVRVEAQFGENGSGDPARFTSGCTT
jgi:hypothetical protein